MFINIIYFMLALFIFHTGTADRLTVSQPVDVHFGNPPDRGFLWF